MQFKRVLKYLFFVGFLVSLGFLFSFSKKKNSQKKVTDINIEFQQQNAIFLNHEIVNKLLIQNDETVKNKEKSVIDLYSLEQKVKQNPYVENAAVFLTVDGSLKASIKQRNPVARIVGENSAYYVDKEGVVVPISDIYSARVLLISGIKSKDEIKEMLPLINKINRDVFLKKEIIGVRKLKSNDLQFAVRSGDYKIDFGKNSDLEIKFKKLKAFYNKNFEDSTINNYKKISLKYHNQVVCTK